MQAQDLLRQGELKKTLEGLQEQVRKDPSDPKQRVFLFQLLSVMGQWDRAMTQLNVAADLDPLTLPMAQMCRAALNSEALRSDIFHGKKSPVVFGEPEEWLSWMIQANQLLAHDHFEQAAEFRNKALEAAPAVSGKIFVGSRPTPDAEEELKEHAFEWLADADPRLGPVLEAIINGRYYWVPFHRIYEITIDAPTDLRDLVWLPAQFKWVNGGESVGMIPTRYPGSEASEDPAVLMSRKTDWVQRDGDLATGLGQRLLATDADDFSLLDTRKIVFNVEVAPEGSGQAAAAQQEPADG